MYYPKSLQFGRWKILEHLQIQLRSYSYRKVTFFEKVGTQYSECGHTANFVRSARVVCELVQATVNGKDSKSYISTRS
ncbi:hypothetical protein Trydic_g9018 [Trypoxylus dichotomus]